MSHLVLCAHKGCTEIAEEGSRFCKRHKGDAAAPSSRRETRSASASQRGYGYRWRKLRNWFIHAHPYCAECLKRGRFVAATDVDHIVPHKGDPSLFWNVENLQALCHECHSRKTASEDGGFGNRIK